MPETVERENPVVDSLKGAAGSYQVAQSVEQVGNIRKALHSSRFD
jgi:hypothetical protein